MNNLLVRALTGAVFVVSVIGSLWFDYRLFAGVMFVYLLGGLWEYTQFFKQRQDISIPGMLFIGTGLFVYALTFALLMGWTSLAALLVILPLMTVYLLAELWRKHANPIANIGAGILGFWWIAFPFVLLLLLSQLYVHRPVILIAVFFLIWTNDTFAYLTGRLIGKTKLFERISPKKTWEGTLGGILFCLVVAWIIASWIEPEKGLLFWMVTALLTAVSAILGDLLESLMKRSLNLKDSGNLLPGHGGVLDRFDATLTAIPIFTFWLLFFDYFYAV